MSDEQLNKVNMNFSLAALIFVQCFFRNLFQVLAMSSSGTGGLKSVQVQVPPYRNPGDTAILLCDYDLGNDTLYSVKWYKEHEEFYRYVPKQRPRANSYAVEGVEVDMTKSDSKKVVLQPVTWKTSGLYKCEVSAEAPSFASAQSEGRMEVVALPQEDPIITGVESQYQIGDRIDLNCTSGKSYPPSVLHWYINEQQVTSPTTLKHYSTIHHPQGLYSTTLGLQFILSQRHFQGGSMKVKCVSSVTPEMHRIEKQRESIVQNLPIPDMREALLLGEWTTVIQAPWHVKSSGIHTTISYILLLLALLVTLPS